jgi:two-component system, NtrC family, response regulator AtoC
VCSSDLLPGKSIHPEGRIKLLSYPWPGNVRELSHELERALVFEEAEELRFEHLYATVQSGPSTGDSDRPDWFNERFLFPAEGGFNLEDAINRVIQHALRQTHNNVSAAGRLLGVSRDYVRYRISGKPPPSAGETTQLTDLA